MAQTNTTATLDGLFKAVYGESYVNLVPDNAILTKMVKFKEAERIGKSYQVPVLLAQEQGVTYLAAGDGVQTLNDSVAGVMKNCEVDGAQIILRGQIDYEAAAKASSSKVAFKNGTELLIENLIESGAKRLELAMLYGRSGIGTVSSLASQVITIQTSAFAAGIWSGLEGAVIDVYQGSSGTIRQAGLVIASVDVDARTVTVTGTTTGIVNNDTIFFKGARGKECYGIDAIVTNTGSMFGIDASTFNLWKGSSYSAGSAALTMAKVLAAASKAVARGLNEEAVVLVNPLTWANLNSDQAALRKYDDSYKSSQSENGFEAITYHAQNGSIKVISHPMVKEGEAFLFPPKRLKRVGATDLSFKTPGRQDEIFLHLQDKNAYELRLYANQAIFSEAPSRMVKITGIVNS